LVNFIHRLTFLLSGELFQLVVVAELTDCGVVCVADKLKECMKQHQASLVAGGIIA